MSSVVIRYSSLGDVVLAGAITAGLSPVTFRTKVEWAPVAERLVGVRQVQIADRDPIGGPDRIIDLQNSLRSRRETVGMGSIVRRVRRYDLRRRSRVWWKLGAPPPRVVDRYAAAARVDVAPRPWISVQGPRDAVMLVPGAAWATKRWPTQRWIELGRALSGPLVVLGGPDDISVVRDIAAGIGVRAHAVAEAGFTRTFEALGRGRIAVGSDSGLLHLAAATGMPVVGLFGPTTSEDGFWCHAGAPVELPMACRPCSRFGGDHCPFGDHASLANLRVEQVAAAVRRLG